MDNGTGSAKVQHYICRGVEVPRVEAFVLRLVDFGRSARLSCGEKPSSITIELVLA